MYTLRRVLYVDIIVHTAQSALCGYNHVHTVIYVIVCGNTHYIHVLLGLQSIATL